MNDYEIATEMVVHPLNGRIEVATFAIRYEGPDLTLENNEISKRECGVVSASTGANVLSAPLEAASFLRSMLYELAGLTLQAHAYWDVMEDLRDSVRDYLWELPDGRIIVPSEPLFPSRIGFAIRDSGLRPATADDWQDLQDVIAGTGRGSPHWRLLLASAHRIVQTDMKAVVVRCATALEAGIEPLLNGRRFSMELFRGQPTGTRTPDLRLSDQPLYTSLARLWFSRHGIVHRGEANLYEANPQGGALPLRTLIAADVEEFLRAVPRGIAFVESNPP